MPTTLMERRVRRYSSALLTPRRSKQLDWDRYRNCLAGLRRSAARSASLAPSHSCIK